jgi:hypothetical protein
MTAEANTIKPGRGKEYLVGLLMGDRSPCDNVIRRKIQAHHPAEMFGGCGKNGETTSRRLLIY